MCIISNALKEKKKRECGKDALKLECIVKHLVSIYQPLELHLPLVGLNERFIFQLVTFFSFLIPYLIPHYHTNYLPAWVGTNPPRGEGRAVVTLQWNTLLITTSSSEDDCFGTVFVC